MKLKKKSSIFVCIFIMTVIIFLSALFIPQQSEAQYDPIYGLLPSAPSGGTPNVPSNPNGQTILESVPNNPNDPNGPGQMQAVYYPPGANPPSTMNQLISGIQTGQTPVIPISYISGNNTSLVQPVQQTATWYQPVSTPPSGSIGTVSNAPISVVSTPVKTTSPTASNPQYVVGQPYTTQQADVAGCFAISGGGLACNGGYTFTIQHNADGTSSYVYQGKVTINGNASTCTTVASAQICGDGSIKNFSTSGGEASKISIGSILSTIPSGTVTQTTGTTSTPPAGVVTCPAFGCGTPTPSQGACPVFGCGTPPVNQPTLFIPPTNQVVTTVTPTFTPAPTATPIPTHAISPTPSVNQGDSKLALTAIMPGIGKNVGDTNNPIRPQRNVTIKLQDTNNHVTTVNGVLTFNGTAYTGTVDAGTLSGSYLIGMSFDNTLITSTPGIVTLTPGQTASPASTTLIAGDLNQDNLIDLQDYNLFIACFDQVNCTNQTLSDFNDNGTVDEVDLNILLRSFAIRNGALFGQNSTLPSPTPIPSNGVTVSPTAAVDQNTITIQDFSFSNTNLTIAAGTTVTWTNNGPSVHTVTANNGSFDSGDIAVGQSFSHTFTTPGTYTYHCMHHPTMTGAITVTASATVTPTQPQSAAPTIASINPTSGAIGTQVTITGTGFGSTNFVNIDNNNTLGSFASSNETTLTFTLPATATAACNQFSKIEIACPNYALQITPGTYQVTIHSQGGISNAVSFTVTPGSGGTTASCDIGSYNNTYTKLSNSADPSLAQLSGLSGCTLPANQAVTLNWNAITGSSNYYVWVGSTPQGYNLTYTGPITGTTYTIPATKITSGNIYVMLWTYVGGVYKANEYQFTVSGSVSTTPTPTPIPQGGSTTSGYVPPPNYCGSAFGCTNQ